MCQSTLDQPEWTRWRGCGGGGVERAGGGVKGLRVVNLLVEGDPRVGPEEHQGPAGRAVLAGHDVLELVALGGGAGIQQALEVYLAPSLEGELEVVREAAVPRDLGGGLGGASE